MSVWWAATGGGFVAKRGDAPANDAQSEALQRTTQERHAQARHPVSNCRPKTAHCWRTTGVPVVPVITRPIVAGATATASASTTATASCCSWQTLPRGQRKAHVDKQVVERQRRGTSRRQRRSGNVRSTRVSQGDRRTAEKLLEEDSARLQRRSIVAAPNVVVAGGAAVCAAENSSHCLTQQWCAEQRSS